MYSHIAHCVNDRKYTMGIHSEIKKNWLASKYPTCFRQASHDVWETHNQRLVTIVDGMCKLLLMSTKSNFVYLQQFCNSFINQCIEPYARRTDPGGVVVVCFDSQSRINSMVPSKHNTQRARSEAQDELPYPSGTTWGPQGGLIMPGGTEEVPFTVKRIFFTRDLRAHLFAALSETVARYSDVEDTVRIIIDRCDDTILDDGLEVPSPHNWAEADSSVVYWAVRLHQRNPTAVVVIDTLDSDLLPMLMHAMDAHDVDLAADFRWIHYAGAWIRFNKLRLSIRNTLGVSLFCNIAIACGTDHYDSSIAQSHLSVLARFRWIAAYAERNRRRLAAMTPNEAFDELVLSVAAVYRRGRMGSRLPAVVCTNPDDTRYPTSMSCTVDEMKAEENQVARKQFVTNWTYWFGSALNGAHFACYRQTRNPLLPGTIYVTATVDGEGTPSLEVELGYLGHSFGDTVAWLQTYDPAKGLDVGGPSAHPVYVCGYRRAGRLIGWIGDGTDEMRETFQCATADTVWLPWFSCRVGRVAFDVRRQTPFVHEPHTPARVSVDLCTDGIGFQIVGPWEQMGEPLSFIDESEPHLRWNVKVGEGPGEAKLDVTRSEAYTFLLSRLSKMVTA